MDLMLAAAANSLASRSAKLLAALDGVSRLEIADGDIIGEAANVTFACIRADNNRLRSEVAHGHIITKVTNAMVSVEGEKLRGVTWVKINEVEGGDWAIGGQALYAADVQKMAAG